MGSGKVSLATIFFFVVCFNLKLCTLQSTLLQLLIKELSPVSGSVIVDGKVSYASQEPWVFSGTLRDNILFGLPYKSEWYQRVIEACSLDKVKVNE